jgi:hypothetical protein
VANQLLISTPQAAQWTALSGSKAIGPIVVTGGLGNAEIFDVTLANGDTTVAVPAGCVGVVIFLPVSNTNVITVRTVSGDTGIQVAKTGPAVILFDTASLPASVKINSAGGGGVAELVFF